MNLETPLQTLKFLRVKWPIAQVNYWLNYPTPGLDYFLFDFHFPATTDPSLPLGLCAFAHNGAPPGYFNPYNPDILLPDHSHAALFSGPIKLTSNILSVAEVKALVGDDPSAKEYLLFRPNLNSDHQVYYDVTAVPSTAGSTVGVTVTAKTATPQDGGGSTTNPSPPA